MDSESASRSSSSFPRRILVTGAGGLLGRQVVKWFSRRCDVLAAGHQDLNITDREAVLQRVRQLNPDVIINCAAFSNVDACETQPGRARAVNTEGPHYLAQAADGVGAALVHLSTDYVFDGTKTTPYTIEDEPQPINTYGQSKLAGERLVGQTLARHYIIRVARLFGPGGRNFASDILNIARRDRRLLAIVDEVGSPTYVVDLAERIGAIIQTGHYGTYHVTNQGACSWYEFATTVIQIARLDGITIQAIESADLHRPARRPRYAALRCLLSERLGLPPLRPWPVAYADFVRRQQRQNGE